MKKSFLAIIVLSLIFSGIVFTASTSSATTLTIQLGYEFSGAYEPESGTLPWLLAVFDDNDNPGSVELTMSAPNLMEEEYIKVWDFNVANEFLTQLTIEHFSGPVASTVEFGDNEYKADGDAGSYFDIEFIFNNASALRFTNTMTSVYNFEASDLVVSDFEQFSVKLPKEIDTEYFSAAHVGSIDITGNDNEGSGWIADGSGGGGGGGGGGEVPEPSTIFLLGGGLLILAAGWRRKKKK